MITTHESDLRRTLTAHQYQEEQAEGLYATQPTVCSCGFTPPTRPDSDWGWWVEHVIKELGGEPFDFHTEAQIERPV